MGTIRTPSDFESVCLECTQCGDSVKLAKNKGATWANNYPPTWIQDFLTEHNGCDVSKIKLVWMI